MLGKRLSESMNDIGGDLIADAMVYRTEKTRNVWLRVAAAAAVVALVIGLTAMLWTDRTEPGEQMGMPTVGTTVVPSMPTTPKGYELVKMMNVLKVYACEAKDMENVQLEEYLLIEGMGPSYKTMWSPILNLISSGITLTLVVDEESLMMHEITYDLSVNYGELSDSIYNIKNETGYDDKQVWGKTHTAVNGETIRWDGDELYFDRPQGMSFEEILAEIERIHLDIIIKADGNIVGYAVLEMICTNTKMCVFHAALVDSGYFPKVDGVFQNVSEEYVRELIEKKMTSQAM